MPDAGFITTFHVRAPMQTIPTSIKKNEIFRFTRLLILIAKNLSPQS